MTFKQEVEWVKFTDTKPEHNEWCVFCDKDKTKGDIEDVVIYFGQFKHVYTEQPEVFLPEWMYFAIPSNDKIVPDDFTHWTSLKTLGNAARDNYRELFEIKVEVEEKKDE